MTKIFKCSTAYSTKNTNEKDIFHQQMDYSNCIYREMKSGRTFQSNVKFRCWFLLLFKFFFCNFVYWLVRRVIMCVRSDNRQFFQVHTGNVSMYFLDY